MISYSLATLLSIIEHGFLPMYCTEEIDDLFGEEYELYKTGRAIDIGTNTFPLISFCDIPLTRVEAHVDKYGGYSLGMNQTWGLKNGLTPIVYYDSRMPLFKKVQDLYKTNNNIKSRELDKQTIQSSTIMATKQSVEYLKYHKCFYKPMIKEKKQKEVDYNKKSDTKYNYYHQENEWRYVPNIECFKNQTTEKFFAFSDEVKALNQTMLNHIENYNTLKFSYDDIEYIIVPHKQDIPPLIKRLKSLKKSKRYNQENIELLMTKIISQHHINMDF